MDTKKKERTFEVIDTSSFLLILKVLELVKFYCVIVFWILKISG